MNPPTQQPPLKREESLHSLYLPALAFERLSVAIERPRDRLPSTEKDDPTKTPLRTTEGALRDFSSSTPRSTTKRKPVARPLVAHGTTQHLPHIESSAAFNLEAAGNAAQAKRKKRRVSTAFSEMLGVSSEKKDGEEHSVEGGTEEEERPKHMKRLKTRVTSWFGMKKYI